MEVTQNPDISTDSQTSGFDISAGNIWIYPENYPVREYQFNIVQKALYYNTLVCLPTGLGKTFIAAVIMYNFWRWYPSGKVVFLAPTKPLVTQQIDACYNVMGIPSIESSELTGSINHKARQIAWFKKRVFFATPQVFHNDLENNIIPSELIKCVVIDEAHKALGKHSYCECIRILSEKNQYFRILALSATPGNKIANVHQIVQNLHISHIELRDETSLDIIPYINRKKTDIILVPLGEELEKYKERYISIMDRHVKFLIKCNVIHGQTSTISKGKIFLILREFQKTPNQSGNSNQIKKTLHILLTMYHAYELMVRHGLRAFYKFYQNHSDKFWMNSETQLQELLAEVQTYLGPFPDAQLFINGNIPEIPGDFVFGHNKFLKLRELLLQHFKMASNAGNDTRAIVFVEYRDIVSEVYILLLQARPLIRPQMFVGQAEQKQKRQVKAIEDFRKNHVNVLISTSIGEEGLDVGEVDLIICFDVPQKSPTRLVQRMGRTGRKREGHIIVLVTDGKEHEALRSTIARRESLNSRILNTSNIFSSLYQNNPRMIPNVCNPKCHKLHINVQPKTPVQKDKKSKKADNKKLHETSSKKTKNTKQSSTDIKNTNQLSLSKFLVNAKNNEQLNNDDDDDDDDDDVELVKPTIIETTDLNNKNNLIKASNVKLLTCDTEAVDFLTLCAMKKSEEEIKLKKPKMDTTYVSLTESITSFVDFTVPSIDVLDDLGSYLNNIKLNLTLPEENSQSDYDNDDNFWCNNQCNILSPINTVMNECINVSESRFEDLLDESTDSDDAILDSNENDVNNLNTNVNIEEHSKGESTVTNVRNSEQRDDVNDLNTNCNVPMNTEVSFFEDILNDSFDSIEDDSEHSESNTDNLENNKLKKLDSSINDPSKITTTNNIQEKTNILTLPKVQVKEERSKHCESMLSITQAVNEINKINSKANARPVLVEIKDTGQYAGQKSKYTSINNISHVQSNVQINDYESEDDIFASELDEDSEINTAGNESLNKENPTNKTLPSSKQNIHTKLKRISDNKFKVDTFGWNNDFKSSISAANSKYFNNSTNANITVKNTNTVASSLAYDMWNDTDSEEWISFDQKPKSKERTKNSSLRLSKKLSSIKHSFSNSTSMDNQNDSENDFVINANDIEKLNDLETSYFSEQKSKNYDKSVPSGTNFKDFSLEKVESRGTVLKNLSSFKAPDRYLKKQYSNKTSQSIQSKHIESSRNSSYKTRSIKIKKKMKNQCKYIDNEAEVTFDNSSDESSGKDEDLSGFVSYTQHVPEDEDTRALYLQAVKSPIKRPGAFVFKEPRVPDEMAEMYSQPCSQANESYLEDSFCINVDEDDIDESKHTHGYSILEEAERILENRKRKRMKSNRSENKGWKHRKKRKKIELLSSSTSSEDETEKLRTEIQNESMMLKGLRP